MVLPASSLRQSGVIVVPQFEHAIARESSSPLGGTDESSEFVARVEIPPLLITGATASGLARLFRTTTRLL